MREDRLEVCLRHPGIAQERFSERTVRGKWYCVAECHLYTFEILIQRAARAVDNYLTVMILLDGCCTYMQSLYPVSFTEKRNNDRSVRYATVTFATYISEPEQPRQVNIQLYNEMRWLHLGAIEVSLYRRHIPEAQKLVRPVDENGEYSDDETLWMEPSDLTAVAQPIHNFVKFDLVKDLVLGFRCPHHSMHVLNLIPMLSRPPPAPAATATAGQIWGSGCEGSSSSITTASTSSSSSAGAMLSESFKNEDVKPNIVVSTLPTPQRKRRSSEKIVVDLVDVTNTIATVTPKRRSQSKPIVMDLNTPPVSSLVSRKEVKEARVDFEYEVC